MAKYEIGEIVKGIITGIEPYGVFVKINDKYNGLIHISEMSNSFVKDPKYFVSIDETINVKIIDVDEKNNKLKLSIKDILYKDMPKRQRKKIIETDSGFNTLAYKLPFWIEENLKNSKNNLNIVDK